MLRSAIVVFELLLLRGSATAAPLTAILHREGLVIRVPSLGIGEIRLPPERSGGSPYWSAAAHPDQRRSVRNVAMTDRSALSPDLGDVRFTIENFEDRQKTRVTVWLFTSGNGPSPRPAFVRFDAGDGLAYLTWNFEIGLGQSPPSPPDRRQVALWVHRHRNRITDPAFLSVVSDFFWHNEQWDAPPGSYNRVIDLNRRIIQLLPHHADVYGTTAWLLWSKWISWKQNPDGMPDGKTGLDQALRLLEHGARINADSPEYFLEAGTVLLPVVRHHRPDLAPLMTRYLRRAAELARSGSLAVRAWRTYAGVLYLAGKRTEARRWYQKVLSIAPHDPVARRRLEPLGEPPGKQQERRKPTTGVGPGSTVPKPRAGHDAEAK